MWPIYAFRSWAYLGDVLLGLLQLVRLVSPQQLGLRLPLPLQRALSLLPALPRSHALAKAALWADAGISMG